MKMSETLDPWLEMRSDVDDTHSFEDDFRPFVHMPDSKTYISALETKLATLKGQSTSTSMLDSLVSVKDDHMSSLMSSDVYSDEVPISRTLPMNFIRARFCPERQALTDEELRALVSADHLSTRGDPSDDQSTSAFRSRVEAGIESTLGSDGIQKNKES